MALTRLGLNQAINLSSNTTGTLGVANGGTGLASGTSGQLLKFTGSTTLASSAIATGKVLQVVSTSGANVTSTSSTSFSTNMTVSITPSAATSKVLVLHAPPSAVYLSNNSNYGHTAVFRETGGSDTNITTNGHNGTWGVYRLSTGTYMSGSAIEILDSPNTTASIDYKIRVKVDNASLTMTYGHDASQASMSSLTVMEIGA